MKEGRRSEDKTCFLTGKYEMFLNSDDRLMILPAAAVRRLVSDRDLFQFSRYIHSIAKILKQI